MLTEVTVVKIANCGTSVCGDVAAYISGSLLMCVSCTVRNSVYFRAVQRIHTKKDPLIYAATSPHTDVF